MSATPARTELRYTFNTKTPKADLQRIIKTQGQELINLIDKNHQLEMAGAENGVTIAALRDNVADLKMVIARQDEFIDQAVKKADDQAKHIAALEAKVEQDAVAMRRLLAERKRGLSTPSVEDIQRCCKALGVRSVGKDELMAWLRANPR